MPTTRQILTVAALTLPLSACRSGYEVDVRNMTDQPIGVALNLAHPDGGTQLLASTRLAPGDRTGLVGKVDTRDRVWFETDFAGNSGYPAKMDLFPGRTVLNIRRADEGSRGKLAIEQVSRPQAPDATPSP